MVSEISLKHIHHWLKHMSLEMHCVVRLFRKPSPSRICVADGKYVKHVDPCFAHGVRGIGVKQEHTLQGKNSIN